MLNLKKNLLEYREEYDKEEISLDSLMYLSAMAYAICSIETKHNAQNREEVLNNINESLQIVLRDITEKDVNEQWFDKLNKLISGEMKEMLEKRDYFILRNEWRTAWHGGHFEATYINNIEEKDLYVIVSIGLQELKFKLKEDK